MHPRLSFFLGVSSFIVGLLLAILVTPADLAAQTYKQLPPPGIEISSQQRQRLQQRIESLNESLYQFNQSHPQRSSDAHQVQVLVRAVRLALQQELFFKESQVDQASELLDEANRRLKRIHEGQSGLQLLGYDPNKDQQQLLVGGFQSRIDDSIQPFGIVLPPAFDANRKTRVDIWLHGRGDTKTEIPFLHERMTKAGQYAPDDAVVLHPFGRHCNAFKFAGEVDVYEALDHLQQLVKVDSDRVAIRGFSMGGAGCWHFAVHDPARWFAANPAAGFVDTIVYQGWQDQSPLPDDDVQKKLLRWYDVLPWTQNLSNTRVIAYSGEIDKQRQAADRVVQSAKELGIDVEYVIGAAMGHKIDPPSADVISSQLRQWSDEVSEGPRREIDFVTYTLRYPNADWLTVTGLQQHWSPGRAKAEILDNQTIRIQTEGITQLRIDFHDSKWLSDQDARLEIDGDRLLVADQDDRAGFSCDLIKRDGWYAREGDGQRLRKRPGLQGPIDDAFCDRFLFVLPSRPATHGNVERWIQRELDYARARWKRLMRGEVREVLDSEVTEQQIRDNHLVCFGDFSSNAYLRSIRNELPVKWDETTIRLGTHQADASTNAVVMCYPNPRNPDRYVVINSGLTFREFSNNSNSRQIAMLPDWAMINVEGPDDGMLPGPITAKGFFGEQWQPLIPASP